MLVHLAALARVARRNATATAEDRELLGELEALLGLTLVDAAAGTLTAAALTLAPAAVATLASANTFFDSAERLSLCQARQADPPADDAFESVAPTERAESSLHVVASSDHPAATSTASHRVSGSGGHRF